MYFSRNKYTTSYLEILHCEKHEDNDLCIAIVSTHSCAFMIFFLSAKKCTLYICYNYDHIFDLEWKALFSSKYFPLQLICSRAFIASLCWSLTESLKWFLHIIIFRFLYQNKFCKYNLYIIDWTTYIVFRLIWKINNQGHFDRHIETVSLFIFYYR